MRYNAFSILLLCFVFAACSYPQSSSTQGSDRPGIYVTGAPENAEIIVDGLNMGGAAQFDGKKKFLELEPGAHRVSVVLNGDVLYDQRVFLDRTGLTEVRIR